MINLSNIRMFCSLCFELIDEFKQAETVINLKEGSEQAIGLWKSIVFQIGSSEVGWHWNETNAEGSDPLRTYKQMKKIGELLTTA